MDLGFFIPKDLGFLPTVAILVFGWLGFRWLRDQQREGYKHKDFRSAVGEIFSDVVQTDAFRNRMDRVVGDAVASSFEPITQTLRSHSVDLKDHEKRLGQAEGKIDGILARTQAQRRSDAASPGETP